MAITDFKLTEADFASTGAEALPDKVVGQAEYVKGMIDGPSKDVIMPKHNGLIDAIGEEYAKASEVFKNTGGIIRAGSQHIRMMQLSPTGVVGGWLIDNYGASAPVFRIGRLNADGTFRSAVFEFTDAGAGKFYGNVTFMSRVILGDMSSFIDIDAGNVMSLRANGGVAAKNTAGNYVPVIASAFNNGSSVRFKDIHGAMIAEQARKILNLDFIKFTYKAEYDDGGKIHYGIKAEQADELGLEDIVAYDAEGLPCGIDYSKLTPYLGVIAQDHDERIAKLEKENAGLKGLLISKGLLTQEEVDGLEV